MHSVKFKSARFNNLIDKRVLIVGIGNSAVDAAVNLINEGRLASSNKNLTFKLSLNFN